MGSFSFALFLPLAVLQVGGKYFDAEKAREIAVRP